MEQDPNTPKYDTKTGLPTDYGKSLGLSKVITADSLNNTQTPIKLPENTPTTTTNYTLPEITTPAQQEIARIQAEKTAQGSDISTLMEDLGIAKAKEAKFATEAGADTAQQEYDKYASELNAEQRSLEIAKRNLSGQGLTQNQIASSSQALERQSLQKQADIAILGNAAKGRYDTAISIAKRKVESELAPIQAELDAKKFIYENNKDLFSKAELSKLDTLIKADEAKVAEQKAEKIKSNEMYINALQGKAPQSLILKAKEAIDSGKSSLEVAKILGDYSLSTSEKLDNAYKTAQINKINRESQLLGEPTAKEKKETADALLNAKSSILVMNDKIEAVDLLKKSGGLEYRVGPNRAMRQGAFIGIPGVLSAGRSVPAAISEAKGEGQSFAGGVHKLVSGLALDSLIDAKARGATFGALSDSELRILANSASAINDWEIKDKNGVGTGYWNIDEATFNQELNNIQNLTRRALILQEGKVFTDDETSALDSVYTTQQQNASPEDYY